MNVNFGANLSNYGNYDRPKRQDPDAYAQQYANEKGISLEEAKKQLKALFGDPEERTKKSAPVNDLVNSKVIASKQTSKKVNSDNSRLSNFLNELKGNASQKIQNNTTASKCSALKNNLPPADVDPDTYAQQYATEKGLTLEEAKEQLKAKFGDPEKRDAKAKTIALEDAENAEDDKNDLASFSDFQRPPKVDPDEYAQQYAKIKGISLNKAKEELKAKYGDPEKKTSDWDNVKDIRIVEENEKAEKAEDDKSNLLNLSPEQQELFEKGIPLEAIEQGDEAIRKFAEENNIELTKPNK